MVDTICVIEGMYYSRLLPLVYFRPVYELRCGILKLREKIQLNYPDIPITLHCRAYLADSVREKNPGLKVNELGEDINSVLFINGRVLAGEDFADKVPADGPDMLYVDGETIIAARVSGSNLTVLKRAMNDVFSLSDFAGLLKTEVNIKYINFTWDLISNNPSQIVSDFERLVNRKEKMIRGEIYDGAHLIDKKNIFIDEKTKIKPGAVLDAESGPIYIGKNVKVFSNAVIEGPCFIGDNTTVKIGAKIYEGSSIGEVCKVGGEVEESIIHSYSNKQHDGFLGHSYLGSWVNIGADTNNSDLKNNYGSVKVLVNDERIDSGLMFVGLTMGDHSKTSINTMFNTGSVVGVSANVFGSGFPSKYLPSFSWGGSDALTTYDLERSMDVAKRVMNRRNIKFTDTDERVFRKVFDLTKEERRKRGMPN